MEKARKIMIGILPFFLDKYGYLVKAYEKLGYEVVVLASDLYGTNKKVNERYNAKIIGLPKNPFFKTLKVFWSLLKEKPDYLEIYDYSVLTFPIIIFSKILGINTSIVIIGWELYRNDPFANRRKNLIQRLKDNLKRLLTWKALHFVDLIIVKEFHSLQIILKQKKLENKTIFQPNCIPLPEWETIKRISEREIHILWLNRIHRVKKAKDLVTAIGFFEEQYQHVYGNKPNVRVKIVGFNVLNRTPSMDPEYEYEVLKAVEEHNKKFSTKIEVLPFTDNPHEFYRNSKIFVLISEIVFLNYALLEAMSYGMIPIISKGEGYEKVILENYNGFTFEYGNVEELARKIFQVLTLPSDLAEKISENAYNTVKENFSIETWVKNVMKARIETQRQH
ncbi:glycosyltransferase family 4 protein [Pseudothermotoga thermarum]|uniref:Glycosyl transferase group 1 n=1 Tax=Pseudothermotoga thermarum DSM 5069 TaxID=688269 RepID=F7YVK6_9THEM|nr:glycosyltransferase family 4 protein [Pseudothermotoga thermarum]AEH51662.1 glycosyl transferase group 1 [Pseudothermotoga thermarum DSM 5069]